MKLLIEEVSATEGNIITEAVDDGKHVWLSGIFMQAETKNRNGRIYPLNEMVNAVSYMSQQIKDYGGIFGELDHPSSLTINMDRISHVITEVRMDGNNVIGKAKLLNTPMGLIAQELAKSGVKYGVSSRGAGNVNESGHVSSYSPITVDIVANASAQGAYPDVLRESIDRIQSQQVMTLAEHVKHDKEAQEFFKKKIREVIQDVLKRR